jgi:O-acetyl-ADP-ribose deacetylase (regulator of RNase III)
MPTFFTKGDLFTAGLPALAHGCNCAGAMGKGIALEFRSRYPEMYQEYKTRCQHNAFRPGDVFAWQEEGKPTVFNLATQECWRTNATIFAIRKSVYRMIYLAAQNGVRSIGLPKIGAGLGALNWEDVKTVLIEAGNTTYIKLSVFETYIKN